MVDSNDMNFFTIEKNRMYYIFDSENLDGIRPAYVEDVYVIKDESDSPFYKTRIAVSLPTGDKQRKEKRRYELDEFVHALELAERYKDILMNGFKKYPEFERFLKSQKVVDITEMIVIECSSSICGRCGSKTLKISKDSGGIWCQDCSKEIRFNKEVNEHEENRQDEIGVGDHVSYATTTRAYRCGKVVANDRSGEYAYVEFDDVKKIDGKLVEGPQRVLVSLLKKLEQVPTGPDGGIRGVVKDGEIKGVVNNE